MCSLNSTQLQTVLSALPFMPNVSKAGGDSEWNELPGCSWRRRRVEQTAPRQWLRSNDCMAARLYNTKGERDNCNDSNILQQYWQP